MIECVSLANANQINFISMKKSILYASLIFLVLSGLQAPLQAQETIIEPSFSLSEIPQVAVEARLSKLMPTKAVDGFSETPLMPFSEEGEK